MAETEAAGGLWIRPAHGGGAVALCKTCGWSGPVRGRDGAGSSLAAADAAAHRCLGQTAGRAALKEAVIAAARAYRAAYDADTDEEEKTTRRALDEALAALDGT